MASPLLLRALRHPPFRLYFFGQLVSLHGTWMQNVAQAWLVYRLTASSFMLGLVSFCALLPVLLIGLLGGVAADRLPRRRLFMATQIVALVQALLLAVLTFSGHVQVGQIMVLAVLLGVAQAFDMPARHSMMAGLVPRDDLPNAIALNASLFNVSRFLGPALAGWLVARYGEAWVFLLNAASFLAVILAVRAMPDAGTQAPARAGSARAHLREGLSYAWQQRPIRTGLLMLGVVSLVGAPYLVLMPVFAAEIFGGGAQTLGTLLGSAGAGALLGALALAQRRTPRKLDRVIGAMAALGGLALCAFAFTRHLGAALPELLVSGFCMTTLVASINTFIQLRVPDELRGRIMALFSVTFIGVAPLGNLIAGSLAHVAGAPFTVAALGVACVLAGLMFLRRSTPAQS